MAMKQKDYKKLPGVGLKSDSFFELTRTRVRLWEGKDHLLCQYYSGYAEDYKRFYYEDIQAVTIRKSIRYMLWNLILLAIVSGFAFLGYRFSYMQSASYTAAAFAFIFFSINLILGPTCVCYLYTFVTEERLFSLNRIRSARKVINRLGPLILRKQDKITADQSTTSLQVEVWPIYRRVAALIILNAKQQSSVRNAGIVFAANV
jgi:hypothetical protein